MKSYWKIGVCAAIVMAALFNSNVSANWFSNKITLHKLGSYSAGAFDEGAAEIAAHDPRTQRLFVVNALDSSIDVIDISNPNAPAKLFAIDVTPYGDQANSVDVRDGIVAAAVQADVKTDAGKVVFFNAGGNCAFRKALTVGSLPDMVTFTPDGKKVLVANEAEPNSYNQPDSVDPEGSVSIVDLKFGLQNATVKTATFTRFNNAALDRSVRIYGPNATVAQDIEPEYITVSEDSRTAWVTLQENNAIAELDISRARFTEINGLGFKDHSKPGNGLDASDRDGPAINIARWPVYGMYQPDAIASFQWFGHTFLITANEGDAREWPGLTEEARISSLTLDPTAFPDAAFLKQNTNIGRLNVTKATGDFDGDGDYDALFALGGRSFSIWTTNGHQVYDSKDDLEQITASAFPINFNASNTNNSLDDRSDNKGPEPEAVTVGRVFGRQYAFIGLERIGGVVIYDLSIPFFPRFVDYVNNRDFTQDPETGMPGDLGPEGLKIIPAHESPIRKPLLVTANEISGTTTIFEIRRDD